tara:strand:- start:289 stop:732 length:444 start_codon:yes stop_codon:yes gene_type:complete
MHINVGVEDIDQSIKFYNALFGAEPVKHEPDYAKWMLEDPRINFAISNRSKKIGVDHLGLQVDDDSELEELRQQLRAADLALFDEGETICCYANSDKSWAQDPSGVAWEAFRTMEDVQLFSGTENAEEGVCCDAAPRPKSNCCAPAA